jgi:hypothetical protein
VVVRPAAFLLLAVSIISVPCASAPVAAQPEGAQVPRIFGTFTPSPGVWAEYEIANNGPGGATKMRISIVGKEGDAYWYEVQNESGTSVNVIKMLVTGDPGASSENIRRMIIKSGDSPAMEMNPDFLQMGRQMASHMFEKRSGVNKAKGEGKVEELGRRTVTVPAGTFETTQYRIRDAQGSDLGTYDTSPSVPPFGVILSETPEATMRLLGHGGDAVSAITENPQPMMPPGGMFPGGMPPGGMPPRGGHPGAGGQR